ncbi:MAG: SapC family protein [Burkholderiaceae bacterium]|nr:SapC family protein [Burkholderiaceae bacterium]
MFEKLVPLNQERHARTLLSQATDFGFAKHLHMAYLTLQEFSLASPLYPIVFVEHDDSFSPMALLGLSRGQNLFVNADGRWEAHYIPAIVRRYPFALVASNTPDQFTVCIDEGSPWVGSSEGKPLFDANGQPTAVIDNVKRYLAELQQMDVATAQFSTWLQTNNMLIPLRLRVRDQDAVRQITGCYVVNEERLNGLSDMLFLELRSRHFLRAVYAHLLSLAQVERLVELSAERHAAQTRPDRA